MRIVLGHHAFPPHAQGGSEIYTEALARALARDHEVTVIFPVHDVDQADYETRREQRDGFTTLSIKVPHWRFDSYRDPELAARVTALVLEAHADILHLGNPWALSIGLVFGVRAHGIPVVFTLHDFGSLCSLGQLLDLNGRVCPGPSPSRCVRCLAGPLVSGPGLMRSLAARWPLAASWAPPPITRARHAVGDRLETMRRLLRTADAVISPSSFLKERFASLGVEGIEHVPNGQEPLVVPPKASDPEGRVHIGFVGTAIPSKGVHVLAEAFARLERPSATLRIHGGFVDYHGYTGYESRLRMILGVHADEALRGPFYRKDLGHVLAGLDVLVVPSIWEENEPLVVEEAFQARLPLVVSRHGGLIERVRDGIDGLYFRPGDVDDLVRTLRQLVDDPLLRARLGKTPPPVTSMEEHVGALMQVYDRAQKRYRDRVGRVGVVVVDRGRASEARRAVRSAGCAGIDVPSLIVENGGDSAADAIRDVEGLKLEENRGYAGGANAGIAHLGARGCDRFLVLNNDVILDPGAVRSMAEALEDPALAAVGPRVLRPDGGIESEGLHINTSSGRVRLRHHGRRPRAQWGYVRVDAISGAAWMIRGAALEAVGRLDETLFHGFEDVEWCLRARAAGWAVGVVLEAVARHEGSRTLGPASPLRLYYAARNHARALESSTPASPTVMYWARRGLVSLLNLAHAIRQGQVPRATALPFTVRGILHSWRGRTGPL